MLNVALAVLSGLIWGIGDFAGGKATQRAGALLVVWVSKLVSLPLLAIYLIAMYVPLTPIGLAWGAMAGVAGLVGLVLFYRALSAGAMTIVAPVTGVTSAAIPVVVGLVWGERPSGARLLGIGCALLAIALVSVAPNPSGRRQVVSWRLIAVALGSGAGFGLFFILLAVANEAAGGSVGLWPIAGSQLSALIIGGLLILMARPGPWPRGVGLRFTMLAGPCDMTANALFLLAARTGDLSIVAPLAALYPVTTVILALIIDHERLRGVQIAGLAFAVAALVLVSSQ
ncbi:MAG: EamA/RhaT family transporter [Propionibacteriaceae bacterium]|nr:EamA/RhaT family transporter [Propionibacteriaceae bacterium]